MEDAQTASGNVVFLVVLLCAIAGVLGGFVNLKATTPAAEETAGKDATRSIVLGLGAAFLTPLFLEMMSSTLLRDVFSPRADTSITHNLFLFFGFALLAAISSRAFIQSMTDRVLSNLKDEADENRREVQTTDEKLEALLEALNADTDEAVDEVGETTEAVQAEAPGEREAMVLGAFQDARFSLRSLGGIAGHAGIPRSELAPLLEALQARNLLVAVPRKGGGSLWSITHDGQAAYRRATADAEV